jgi:hypothetical protein
VTTDDIRERYEVLYRSTYPAVVAYVLRRVPDRCDAADVVAETYLTLWRRFDSIRGWRGAAVGSRGRPADPREPPAGRDQTDRIVGAAGRCATGPA